MEVVVLIDYDNLTEIQKVSGMLDIATRVLMQLPINTSDDRAKCELRIYGGWYEEDRMTQLAQKLSVSIQDEFPVRIRVPIGPDKFISFPTSAELAMALAEEPSHHLFNTYQKKGKPSNLRVQKPEEVGCANANCFLRAVQKLLKSGACPDATCAISRPDLVYRGEQKIVDTMLTCDLLYYSKRNYSHIVLISGDTDFLPPIRTALLHGSKIYRVNPKPSNKCEQVRVAGAQLAELEI